MTPRGPRSGLLYLRNAVEKYFEDNDVPALVTKVGLKYRSFQRQSAPSNANRVVFIPGEFTGELAPKLRRYGALSRATRNHASVVNPRELLAWDRPFTLSIWSAPVPGASENEGETVGVAEDLLEQVARAITYAEAADVIWGEVDIIAPPVEGAFGVELLAHAIQRGPLFDVARDVVVPKTGTITKIMA